MKTIRKRTLNALRNELLNDEKKAVLTIKRYSLKKVYLSVKRHEVMQKEEKVMPKEEESLYKRFNIR
ncbi:MAG: hypothetical protein ACTTJJ_09925 [Prevotella fusca]|uniref:hypothetical protein n=1 Tax=Prevotella fusca TaxID=589436 RepID=UPI003FA0F8D9